MTKHDLKELAAMGAELGAAKAEVERLRGLLHDAHDTIRNLAEDLDEEEFQVTIDQLAEIELALAPQQAEPDHDCNYRTGGVICKVCDLNVIKQAEDTDTYTAVDMATAAAQGFRDGQAAVEQAPAQDEQQPKTVPEGWLIELGFDVLDRPFRFVDSKSHTPTIKVILPACEPDDSSSWDLRDEIARRIGSVLSAPIAQTAPQAKFRMGDLVKKSTGSEWVGRVVGWYSTEQTPEGYAVESSAHRNSVQIYPAKALEAV